MCYLFKISLPSCDKSGLELNLVPDNGTEDLNGFSRCLLITSSELMISNKVYNSIKKFTFSLFPKNLS